MACCCGTNPCGADARPKYIYATLVGTMTGFNRVDGSAYSHTFSSYGITLQRSNCGVQSYEWLVLCQGAAVCGGAYIDLEYLSSDTVMKLTLLSAEAYAWYDAGPCTASRPVYTLGPTQGPRSFATVTYLSGPATYEYTESTSAQNNNWGWIVGKIFSEKIKWQQGVLLTDYVTPCVITMEFTLTIDAIGN